jgi:hypothetical protein
MIYKSKKDSWLVLIVLSAGLAVLGMGIYHFVTKGIHHPATWILGLTTLFYGAVILMLAYPVFYEIKPSGLRIRSGLFIQYEIPLSSIETVRPTRNPLSAPAWSLDRLQIIYRKDGRSTFALISPENKEFFLMELAGMAPHLQPERDELITGNSGNRNLNT